MLESWTKSLRRLSWKPFACSLWFTCCLKNLRPYIDSLFCFCWLLVLWTPLETGRIKWRFAHGSNGPSPWFKQFKRKTLKILQVLLLSNLESCFMTCLVLQTGLVYWTPSSSLIVYTTHIYIYMFHMLLIYIYIYAPTFQSDWEVHLVTSLQRSANDICSKYEKILIQMGDCSAHCTEVLSVVFIQV